jgi:hypothetical protein
VDIFAHALWAGAGVMLARRRWSISTRTATATVGLAVLPDIPHLLPIVGWSLFGSGNMAAVQDYATAAPDRALMIPPLIDTASHILHCIPHSAVVAGLVTLLVWFWTRSLWIPLLGWWLHIVIDVFTHSKDYYESPVFWPITRQGFDGIAWNTPWFMALNYLALAATYVWLILQSRRAHFGRSD